MILQPRMLNYTFFREMTVGKTRFLVKISDFALKLVKNHDFVEKNAVGNRGWLPLKNAFSDMKSRIRVKHRVLLTEIVFFCNHTLHHPKTILFKSLGGDCGACEAPDVVRCAFRDY